jgi:hypothetical protein
MFGASYWASQPHLEEAVQDEEPNGRGLQEEIDTFSRTLTLFMSVQLLLIILLAVCWSCRDV